MPECEKRELSIHWSQAVCFPFTESAASLRQLLEDVAAAVFGFLCCRNASVIKAACYDYIVFCWYFLICTELIYAKESE